MSDDIVTSLRCLFVDCDGTCATVVAADEIVRLRAVLDAIDAIHAEEWVERWQAVVCAECATVWPCQTHLLVRPQGADNAPA